VRRVIQAHQEHREHKGSKVPQDSQGQVDRLDSQELQEAPVPRELPDRAATSVCQGYQVHPDFLEPQDSLAVKAHPVQLDLRVLLALRERLERLAFLARLEVLAPPVSPEPLDRQELLELLALEDFRALLEPLDQRVQLVPRDLSEHQVLPGL